MKKLSEDDLKLIGKFMSDDLSHEETLSFNEKLQDPDFNQELDFQKGVARSINDVHRNLLREAFKKQLQQPVTTDRKRINPVLYWAAAALALAAMTGIYFFHQADNTEGLFTAYYQPYPTPVITRGDVSELPKEIEQSLSQYRLGEYDAAAKSLEAILSRGMLSNTEEPKLLLGNCYLQLNKLPEAQFTFTNLSMSHDTAIKQHAEWYLALTLLKANQPEKALPLLNTISQSNSIYHQQASNLAKTLNANN